MICTWEYLVGDVRDVLAQLDDQSIQCIVTSPPYWRLRDYGIPPSVWGEEDWVTTHEHEWGAELKSRKAHPDRDHSNVDMLDTRGEQPSKAARAPKASLGSFCRCGAWRGCLGLEPTPEMFVEHLVEVCRGLWRVLRDDGVMFLNIGDCYSSGGRASGGKATVSPEGGNAGWHSPPPGLKHKDLVMMPHRVALALQADGWWVRSTIVWSKPNPMPESCTDRPTSSHEYIFQLVKRGKPIYWTHREFPGVRKRPRADYRYLDLLEGTEAIDRPDEFNTFEKLPCPDCVGEGVLEGWFGVENCGRCKGKGKVRRWRRINLWKGHDYFYDADAVRVAPSASTMERWNGDVTTSRRAPGVHQGLNPSKREGQHLFGVNPSGRNLHNVWQIATQPYPKAHFATFPERIPELCIKAGTSERGCCPQCGAPWERVVEKRHTTSPGLSPPGTPQTGPKHHGALVGPMGEQNRRYAVRYETAVKTTGFQPTCECQSELEPVPCVVLDPFGGSGTTLKVARELRRSAIAIDINPKYKTLAEERAMLAIPDIMTFKEEDNDQGS